MFSSMLWSMVERISVQAVQFVLGIVLARILSPTEYGIIGLLLVFIAFMQVFVDAGFGKALIQKQDRTQLDLSTVFFFNIFTSIFCYVVLWFLAPVIAKFYNNDILINLLRVLSISLFLGALFSVHLTLLTIKLDFKTIAKVNFISILVSGVIAIYMAYDGYGVWALVFQYLLKSFLMVALMWLQVKWKPSSFFSKSSFKSLFSFGSKLLISSVLNMSVNNFTNIFIAKFTSIKDLGFYTRGTQFADIIFNIFNSVLNSVLLPSLSTVQKEKEKLIHLSKITIKSATLIIAPVLLGLAAIAEPLIKFLLGDKWLLAIPIMQILCIARLITIVSGINVNILYVIGRSDLALRQQYSKIIVRVILIVLALKYGIVYIAFAELTSTMIHFFINTHYPGKYLSYGSLKQIKDLLPILFSSIIMALCMYSIKFFVNDMILQLVITIIMCLPIYLILVNMFKVKEVSMISIKLREMIASKKA